MMLLDYFGFLVGFLEKWTKSANLVNFRGPTPWHRDPTQQRKSTPRRGMSTPWRDREGGWTSLGYAAVKVYVAA